MGLLQDLERNTIKNTKKIADTAGKIAKNPLDGEGYRDLRDISAKGRDPREIQKSLGFGGDTRKKNLRTTPPNQNPQSDNPFQQASQDPMANVQPWLDYGIKRGDDLFSDLGRFNQNEKYGQGQDDVMAALQNRMQGTGDPQFNLMRERALEGQQRGLAQNLQLGAQQSGRSGVRGAGAMGVQQQALDQNSMDRRGLERDLALEQSDRQQQAEGNLAAYLQDLTQQQFEQDQYNNQQLEKERMGKFASEMGFGGMGMLDQGQQRGLEAANTIANMPQPQMPADKGFMDRQYGGGWMDTFITPMGFMR